MPGAVSAYTTKTSWKGGPDVTSYTELIVSHDALVRVSSPDLAALARATAAVAAR